MVHTLELWLRIHVDCQQFLADLSALSENHCSLDRILQFPHIAWPGVGRDGLTCAYTEHHSRRLQPAAGSLQDRIGEL